MNKTMKYSLLLAIGMLVLLIFLAYLVYDAENQQTATPAQQQTSQVSNDTETPSRLNDFSPLSEQATELQIVDLEEGDGAQVTSGDTVTAHYTGAYGDSGEVFETSYGGEPATFPLNQVIPGWQEGVPGMKVGGVRRLIIPGNLAYGEAPDGYVPGSTQRPLGTLVFDIELVELGDN